MKITTVFFALLLVAVLSGCGGPNTPLPNTPPNPTTPEEPAAATVGDYFPLLEDTLYRYSGEGNEYAAYTVYNDYSAENSVQQRTDNGGTVIARVILVDSGKLTQVYSSGEAYYRENSLDKHGEEEVLLAEPITEGNSWTLADGRTRTISSTQAAVSTPYGEYDNALEVTTEGENGTTVQYYVKEIGLVKTVFQSEGGEVSSTLEAIESDVPAKQMVRFYFPEATGEGLYYEDRELEFYTNDVTEDVLAEAYRTVPEGAGKVFSANTAINSLTLDEDGVVHLDLNQAFRTEMNAGSGFEAMILRCVAGTFGGYYGADEVALTIDGELYSSGHIELKEDEYLPADMEDAILLPEQK